MNSPMQSRKTEFAVLVSEKGGAERREVFERPEISIGRVQGNELMLPKGNVSKRHARLLFRDSRFIVTDLNSTNGTYVNRRRISQATIVREGDRVYIGDFVLRIEHADGASEEPPSSQEVTGSGPVRTQDSPSHKGPEAGMTHVPLEKDPDDSGGSYPHVPPAPRAPATRSMRSPMPSSDAARSGRRADLASGVSERSQPISQSDSLDPSVAAFREALGRVVTAAARVLGPAVHGPTSPQLQESAAGAVSEAIRTMQASGEIAESISAERLQRHACAELVELGPIGGALEDDEVGELSVSRYDRVVISRGDTQRSVEPPFSSAESLDRVLSRLCESSGRPRHADETVIERRLPSGARLAALCGRGALTGTCLTITKPRRLTTSLESLVRRGTISRAIATFLGQCVSARVNLLVIGPRAAGASHLLNALSGAVGDGHLVIVQGDDEIAAGDGRAIRIAIGDDDDASRMMAAATRSSEGRLVVDSMSGAIATATLDLIGQGDDGVVAACRAPGLRRGLSRVVADLMGERALTLAGARESVAASFDIVLEVAKLRDGRSRVLRVAEVVGVRGEEIALNDIFNFHVERTAAGGAIEGSFTATGTVPMVMEDFRARGVPVERSLFTRPPSR